MAVLGSLTVSGLVHQDYRPTSIVTVDNHYERPMNQVTNFTGRVLAIRPAMLRLTQRMVQK